MKCLVLFIFSYCIVNFSNAQMDTATLEEVVVSGTKFSVNRKSIVQKIEVLNRRYITNANAQNTGDLLIGTGNIFVQKSQQGGSSPVIRGFEASRILLVVDGIRMNNALYRAGHLQNVITVDQNMLERMEVMYGPSSTLYGSDALGGMIHMVTKNPVITGKEFLASGNALARYSSVNNEKTEHMDLNLGFKKIAFLTSFTYSDFGDMRMGSHYPAKYPGLGRRSQYVTNVNNSLVDSVVQNPDDRVQKFSGYTQWDLMQKVLFKQGDHISHLLNLQFSNSSNVPRYDRLQDVKGGTLRYAEWYYGPQERNLYGYTFHADQLAGFFNEMKITLSYQDIKESRQTREYRRYDRFDSRREHVKVWGAIADFRKVVGDNSLSVGADAQFNEVKSVADRTNLKTGAVTKLDSRYSNGNNTVNYAALYAQHVYKFAGKKWVLNDGLRLQFVNLRSTITDNSFFNLPVTDARQNSVGITGNLGFVFSASQKTRLNFGLASGFRAPNIDDLAKIFESNTAAKQVIVPNTGLKPEYSYNLELGLSQSLGSGITAELNGFYTVMRNAIVSAPFKLNGADSINYNGTVCAVYASQNHNRAYLYGGSLTLNASIGEHFNAMTTISYTYGRYKTPENSINNVYQKQPDGSYVITQKQVAEKPLDHVPPVFGKTSIQYHGKAVNVEFFALYNGWKRIQHYNADGEDNQQYATADGMPSWLTLNLKGSVTICKQVQLQMALENIFDRNYRYFASGFSAPGRNFVIAIRSTF